MEETSQKRVRLYTGFRPPCWSSLEGLQHAYPYNFPLRDVVNFRVPGGGEMRDPGTRLRLSETLKHTENSFHGTMCHAVLGSL